MRHSLVGFYPVQQFLDDFLPLPDHITCSSTPSIDFSSVPITKQEKEAYDPLVDAINNSDVFSGFTMRNTCSAKEEGSKYSPDLGAYRAGTGVREIPFEVKKLGGDICNSEMPKPKRLERNTQWASENRGQIFTYLAHQMFIHPRLFVFMVFIYGDRVRILHVDRSGGTITASFGLKDTNYLAQFLYRYSQLTDAQRGWDTTVAHASAADGELLTRAVKEFKARVAPRNVEHLNPTLDERFLPYKIHMSGKTVYGVDVEFDLIVRRPFTEPRSLRGRCTRGYAAYHVQEERLVFLKDSWRRDDGRTISEMDMYAYLSAGDPEDQVPNLPDILAMGDVVVDDKPQTTRTQNLTYPPPKDPATASTEDPTHNDPDSSSTKNTTSDPPSTKNPTTGSSSTKDRESWRPHWMVPCNALEKLVHNRIVQEMALPLESASDSKEAVQAIHDAAVCIKGAYKKKAFHRDVSGKNVMIRDFTNPATSKYPGVRSVGILNDWDHAIIFGPRTKAHEYRTGTWAFMSIKLLKYPGIPHEVHDDLESCLWVLIHLALHRFKQKGPADFDLDFFTEMKHKFFRGRPHLPVGGNEKVWVLQRRSLTMIKFISPAVIAVLSRLLSEWGRYAPLIHAPGVDGLGPADQRLYDRLHARLENPDTTISKIRNALLGPGWICNDMEKVDKYPPRSENEKRKIEADHDSAYLESVLIPHWEPDRNFPEPEGAATSAGPGSVAPHATHPPPCSPPLLTAHTSPYTSGMSNSMKRLLDIDETDNAEDSASKRIKWNRGYPTSNADTDHSFSPDIGLEVEDLARDDHATGEVSSSQDDYLEGLYEDPQSAGPSSTYGTPPQSSPASSFKSLDPLDISEPDSPTSRSQPEDAALEEPYIDPLGAAAASSMTSVGESSTRVDLWKTIRRPPMRTYAKKDRKGKGKIRRD
ncbi:hypothetical protein QCA50_010813 [Cerrena zonata]|uniref:Fungal-type protein kinase domain-containing protein n=1 Tax=Cerrena zonata TaxID=2478898 RepID=A0AAW0G0U3_9APHY